MKQKTMNQNLLQIEQFKLKYANELNVPNGNRRKFSVAFKAYFLTALEESQLKQSEFCETIGVCSSLVADWRRRLIRADKKPTQSSPSFQFIPMEEYKSEDLEIYIQYSSGIRIYGLKISQVAGFLRSL